MAELAIPLALMGGMYIMSNQDKPKKNVPSIQQPEQTETFVNNRTLSKNMTSKHDRPLPNENYPVETSKGQSYNHKSYEGNTTGAKYYQHENVQKYNDSKQQGQTFQSLTGEIQDTSSLKHNNMQPFFGSRVRQSTMDVNDSRMDYLTGAGSTHIQKKEQAPLFAPQAGLHYANGAPSNVDFIQERVVDSLPMRRANEKPWEEIRVAPGLGQGAGTQGSGGFNSGMEAREQWLDRNVDELRVKSNPKITYGGVVLGGKAHVTERGKMGTMEKHLPDRHYENSPDRYFTTTGQEKAPTSRSQQVAELMPEENRDHVSYYGNQNAGNNNAGGTYVPQNFRAPMRQQLDSTIKHASNLQLSGKQVGENEYGVQGYKSSIVPNNRDLSSKKQPEFGIATSIVKAMVTPIMDMLRPSRKQNVVGNIRSTGGNVNGVFGNKNGYVMNPADRPKTTIKEMTVHGKDHMFADRSGQNEGGGYDVANPIAIGQQRDTTSYMDMGNMGGRAATTGQTMLYDAHYSAETVDKAPLSRGRAPMGGGPRMLNHKMNMTTYKDENLFKTKQFSAPSTSIGAVPSVERYGQVDRRTEYGQDIQAQRMQTMDFTPFNDNPYTHSLNGVVNR